jgi:transcription antitermination factor NusG
MRRLTMIKTPPILTPGYESIEQIEGNWYVAHTKSRFEKAFVMDLMNMGICHFLPMKEKVYVSGGKKRRSMLPLFTSYVFFCSRDTEAKTMAFKTGRLASIMDVVDRERFVSELSAVYNAVTADFDISLVDQLPLGVPCRITGGVMMGTEGTVIGVAAGKAKVVLEVYVLGKGVEMEIDSSMVEKI